jgi:hypothetical protein
VRVVIAVLGLIAAGATALLVAWADARPNPGTYLGKTSEGRTITIEVAGNTVRSVEADVLCGGRASSVRVAGRAPLRGGGFNVTEDYLLSGGGAENEAIHVDGRFDGTELSGWIDYGRSWRCTGHTHYRTELVHRR